MLVAATVIGGAVVLSLLLTGGHKSERVAQVGALAPPIDLPDVRVARPRVVLAALRGKPVLVNFWATWCTPCVREMPLLEAAHKQFGSKVQFIGIDRQDYRPDALAFVQRTHVTYPSASDPDATLDGSYRLRGMPTSVFIDARGRVVQRVTGPLTRAQLDDGLKALTAAGA